MRAEVAPIIGADWFKAVEQLSEIIGRKLPYPFHDEIRGIATAASMKEGGLSGAELSGTGYLIFT